MAVNKNNLPFDCRIAVVTCTASVNEEEFRYAEQLVAKYGADRIVHVAWPENFMAEQEQMIGIFATLAADMKIRALIITNAVPGTNAAVDRLLEARNDIFIVYCSPQEAVSAVAERAGLILGINNLGMGPAMVHQAKKQGAKVFIHYSFPRHMAEKLLSGRRELIRDTCATEGIQFVDATAPDPTGEAGLASARQLMLEEVPRMVAMYGEDTAFFCTNCHLQIPLIKAVVDCHAIYVQPCCPSPYHGFPQALGIETDKSLADLNYLISEASRIAEERNMTDRLSTWPVSACMMFMNAGTEYAIKWINEEVPGTGIDDKALADCMIAYVKEVVGEASNVYISSYSDGNNTYSNFKRVLMSYLDF